MHKRTERLHALMAAHNLNAKHVAAMLGRSTETVRIWRVKSDNRVIPEDALRVLELTVGNHATRNAA